MFLNVLSWRRLSVCVLQAVATGGVPRSPCGLQAGACVDQSKRIGGTHRFRFRCHFPFDVWCCPAVPWAVFVRCSSLEATLIL